MIKCVRHQDKPIILNALEKLEDKLQKYKI